MNPPEKIWVRKPAYDIYRINYEVEPPVDELAHRYVEYTLSSLTARWIPVKERLPEKDAIVLTRVAEPNGTVFVAEDKFDGKGWWQADDMHFTVTHWLSNVPPLPQEGK